MLPGQDPQCPSHSFMFIEQFACGRLAVVGGDVRGQAGGGIVSHPMEDAGNEFFLFPS